MDYMEAVPVVAIVLWRIGILVTVGMFGLQVGAWAWYKHDGGKLGFWAWLRGL